MRVFSAIALVLALVVPLEGLGATYPCGSDPGFCYRDVGDDGCFDVGPDTGPINAAIEASSSFPTIPDPGSIVCPPSVKKLEATAEDIYLETVSGSSILFYGAQVEARRFNTISGAELLFGGLLKIGGFSVHVAEEDVEITDGAKLSKASTPARNFAVTSTTGSIVVGSKARFLAGSSAAFIAPLGDITFGDNVKVKLRDATESDVLVDAGGDVTMSRIGLDLVGSQNGTNSSSTVEILGSNVSLLGLARFKTKPGASPARIEILATPGDVTIDRLIAVTSAEVTVSGTNVTIGVAEATSKAIIKKFPQTIDVNATDEVSIRRLKVRTTGDVRIETTGTTVNLLNGDLAGVSGAVPTIDVIGGPGSRCDLTGTTTKQATLATFCDTVVGP